MKPFTLDRFAGLVNDTASTPALGVKGHVEVEFVDPHSGRILDRVDGDNYINVQQWTDYAKVIQKAVWLYAYEGDSSTVTPRALDGRDPRVAPTVRNDHLACWTDPSVEDPTDVFTFGEVTAWAHRWPQGSPSQRQGIVVPALCTLTDSAVSWMFEWALLCGNGTFQSVGWRRLSIGATTPDPSVSDLWLPDRRMANPAGFVDAFTGGGVNDLTFPGGFSTNNPWPGADCPLYSNAADASIYSVDANGVLMRRPVTFDATGNYALGAVADLSASAIAAGLYGDHHDATARTLALTRLGPTGDWIAVGCSGAVAYPSNANYRATVRRVTAAGAVVYTNTTAFAAETGYTAVTFDGANLWAISYAPSPSGANLGGTSLIHRIDPATGNITATINAVGALPAQIPNWATAGPHPIGLAWDATNSWLWVSDGTRIYNISTSGVWQGVLITATVTPDPPSGVFTGASAGLTATGRGALDWDSVTQSFGAQRNVGAAGVGGYGDTPLIGKILSMNGHFWSHSGSIAYRFDGAPNFASRTLLPTPKTKLNTQAMRIRYTMTFT